MSRRDHRKRLTGSRLVRLSMDTIDLLEQIRRATMLPSSQNALVRELATRELLRRGLLSSVGKPTSSNPPARAAAAPVPPAPFATARNGAHGGNPRHGDGA